MIFVDLIVEQGSGPTLLVAGEKNLSTIDNFGNMNGGIVTIDDTRGQKNLVDGVETFSTIVKFGTMIVTTLTDEEN